MAEAEITVNSSKPNLPTLWLDTSVGIKIAKVHRGERLQDIETDRVQRLFQLVTHLVAEGKLLCPEADQNEEFEAERLAPEIAKEYRRLSLGIALAHRAGIHQAQIYRAMKSYCGNEHEIRIPCEAYFGCDPVAELQWQREQKFSFILNRHVSAEILEERRVTKEETVRRWEELRQELVSKQKQYQDQLDLELRSQADSMVEVIASYMKKLLAGTATASDFMGIHQWANYIAYWKRLGCQPEGFDGLYAFFRSDHVANLPIWNVKAKLCADLMTGTEPINSGDPMDVELLSAAVPAAHFVLADRSMETRLKRRAIDQEWNTKIFSMKTIHSLFTELESL
jgi:hypothetical protein